MTNYEAIKKMSVEEMAAVFYMFTKPMMDTFDLEESHKEKMRESIKDFLNTEVKHK